MDNKRTLDGDQENEQKMINKNHKNVSIKKIRIDLEMTQLNNSEYYIENDNRKVYPYPFTYHAYCKERWVGKTLKELFDTEFKSFSRKQFAINKRISKGYLKVNGKSVDSEYILKHNDLLTHRIHRHEFPVLAAPIPIIYSDENFLVIDKPPSLPVHPCGKFNLNSIIGLLIKENNLKDLHVIHRLDRLTSGILIFGRNKNQAQKISEEIRKREMQKEYVCRVDGYFPDGIIECNQPIETLSHRIGICIVSPKGKPCKTIFERLNYNGKSSVVICKPLTGRMHQIRVHLQYLGYPIVNDNFYNNYTFGEKKGYRGEYGKSIEQLISDIEKDHEKEIYIIKNDEDIDEYNRIRSQEARNIIALKALEHYKIHESWKEIKKNYEYKSSKFVVEDDCEECRIKSVDPIAHEQLIYLHALRYKGKNWSFETHMPIWAQESWKYD